MDYSELHCHSIYSLLDGASSPEALVARAAEMGMVALALTDHDAVYGAVRFVKAARQQGVRPILGAELTLEGGYHLTLLVHNAAGWANLCRLISIAQHNAPKGDAALPTKALIGRTEGLIVLTGCRQGPVAAALLAGNRTKAVASARWLREQFGRSNTWIELQHHWQPGDDALVAALVELAEEVDVRYVATNNVHYATRDGHRLHDVLTCIQHNTSLDQSARLRRTTSEYYLKSAQEMATLFADDPRAIENTTWLASRCRFELDYGMQELPQFPTPPGVPAWAYLTYLCRMALRQKYPDAPERVWQQLQHELDVIEAGGLSNYFLVVWDIVRFARDHDIRCQGRGSAANSLVAYLLDISPIDPLAHDLVFERFLSDERQVVPDIDVDFDAARREEVIQYVYERYGHEHAAMACTLVTFRARSALRDVGKALGVPSEVLERAATVVDTRDPGAIGDADDLRAIITEACDETTWNHVVDLCAQLDGVPRHLGLHNGGMVVTGAPLAERVPTEPAAMDERIVVQWDKDGLEAVDLVKIDILGLRMLSAIAETVQLVAETTGTLLALEQLTFDDPAVYAMIAKADTVGVFQVESRAQQQVLPRLRPTCFNDLIISISLIRPGPIQGEMVHPYLRRRAGEEPITYAHPLLQPALEETLGVILFQEQVLKVARDLAGFSAGEGELLRRALGSKDGAAAIEALRTAFLAGAQGNGVASEIAEQVFEQLSAFGSYSFAKSHAAAFAVLVYQSAWLKRYYPAAFFCALLNNQPMGFWQPSVLVGDAKRHGVKLLPVDVNASEAVCTLEACAERGAGQSGHAIRIGLRYVDSVGEAAAERLVATREQAAFTGLRDLCRRTRLPKRLIENLIMAGALDCWLTPRRRLLWELGTLQYHEDELELEMPADSVVLPALSSEERTAIEHEVLGLSTGDHVMARYRAHLQARRIRSSADVARCADGEHVRVAGLAVVMQAPPTAKGYRFLTLEDEFGFVNVVIRPHVYALCRQVLRNHTVLLLDGICQKEGGTINVLLEAATPFVRERNRRTSTPP